MSNVRRGDLALSQTPVQIQSLTVGPIVGHTTTKSVRLWGRGAYDPGKAGPRRCHGIVQLFREGTLVDAGYFPMRPHFDFTGVIDFDQLEAGTQYRFRMGYLFADLESEQLPPAEKVDLRAANEGTFRTMAKDGLSFVFGSCRYLLRLFGGAVFDERGDKTFRSINTQIDEGVKTDFALMLGDQIYADDLNFVAPDNTASAFHARYVTAFTQPHFRRLVSRVPTYMTLDDHEIEDNWSQDEASRKHTLYNLAMHAYDSYQLVHSPAFQPHGKEGLAETPTARWYTFEAGPAHFFILDARTERFREYSPRQLLGVRQMAALKQWLKQHASELKFVGSSVPVFPDTRSLSSDKWSGFPEQRKELLEFIRDEGIEKVVFLSGDVHCSSWSTLKSQTRPTCKVHSLISSAFFWPYPAETEGSFLTSGQLHGAADFAVAGSGGFINDDNFTRVTLQGATLKVEIFDRKGELLAGTEVTP